MDSAFAWIGQIVEWLGMWIPRRKILDTTQGAIKYVGGKRIVVCAAGVHWYWPFMTNWEEYPTARQADRLETQVFETLDGVTIIVGGLIVYEVVDIAALVTTTHSPATTVKDIALTAEHGICCQYNWTDLKEAQRKGTLDTKLKNEAQTQLKTYGVRVIKLMLTSLAKTRVYKISQSTAQEEN